ncbi:MAG: cellulase family glycosylhydrolase [Phycisphaeraceae bacterium]|nr:cellulase family glycosylhydrolase [Phycisphaeraceae bacterium]MCW5755361.1 cellulase family glycosylhydrolase [Phycisphaeraceae bacterium]
MLRIVLLAVLVTNSMVWAYARPPAERLERLARGVNLSHWFWIPHDDSDRGRERFINDEDVKALKAAGFTHVRLPIEPGWLWDARASVLLPERLAALRRGLALLLAEEMAIVVDVHPARTAWLERLDAEAMVHFERFWHALAEALVETDPEWVYLELMNEPHDLPDAATWNVYQKRLHAVVRTAAPRHTIICTGDQWGSIAGLERCEPVADSNVVYSFHFYEPHNFTHQGATWGFDAWRDMGGVPWPATPDDLREVSAGFASLRSRDALQWSATRDAWTPQAVIDRIELAAAWGRRHDAAVYCGEFGVYRLKAPLEARERWLGEVVAALEAREIGWAMWDYAGGFSLVHGGPGARRLDDRTLRALRRMP